MRQNKHRCTVAKREKEDRSRNPSIYFDPTTMGDDSKAAEIFGDKPFIIRLVNKNKRRFVMTRRAERLTWPNMSANERFWKSLNRTWGEDNNDEEND